MIEIENLSKRFKKVIALNQINLSIEPHSCVALIGPNASGKTTLIKSILGLVIPDSGEVTINNLNIMNRWDYRKDIGYMPQIGRYPENMTIRQLFTMIVDLRKVKFSDSDKELIEKFDIDSIDRRALGALSGGTRQKVSACLAFLFDPQILILDEPTAGLDPVATEILKEKILKERSKGKIILITSHVLSDLDELVNQVIILQDGTVRLQKEINSLKIETGEEKLSRVIAKLMGYNNHEKVI